MHPAPSSALAPRRRTAASFNKESALAQTKPACHAIINDSGHFIQPTKVLCDRSTMAQIIIVDDDAVVREMTTAILERDGHSVEQADDGNAGLAAVRARVPELLITDMEMPKMDGVELITELAKEFPHLPIIAMSGAPQSPQYLYLASLLGAEKILTKPFSTKLLTNTVKEVLSRPK